jgi:aminobenzoyl-glutamate utilization protein B
MRQIRRLSFVGCLVIAVALQAAQEQTPPAAPSPDTPQQVARKTAAAASIDGMAKQIQEMVDSVFSFGELGFEEVETSRYLTGILEKHGFTIRRGISNVPTAWAATWGSGQPVIALGSDIDAIPLASQKPGVAYRDPMIAGAPGHGEGHNSGLPVMIAGALAVKQIMEREKLPGTLVLWPGVAEELLGTKAWFVRDGLFKGVDVCIFAHVDNNLSTFWGAASGSGLMSVEYTFSGESAHSAGAPWRGRSALDAVELMNTAWNFRREHLRPQHRVHYVITNGGAQPNVVPPSATVWYYFRESDYPHIKAMWDIGNQMAASAATMTNTTWTSRILGTAWPQHMNRPVAEALHANMQAVGLPKWSADDQTLARALQREINSPNQNGLATEIARLGGPTSDEDNRGGGSDDIGDVSWTVPTVALRYPSNIPGLPGHNWANAVAMATPIAHKGALAGAKVAAMTILDLLAKPELVKQAWTYFNEVQTKDMKYTPFIAADTPAATWLNRETFERFRPAMRKFYYDPSKHATYLEQLGVTYPTVRPAQK